MGEVVKTLQDVGVAGVINAVHLAGGGRPFEVIDHESPYKLLSCYLKPGL